MVRTLCVHEAHSYAPETGVLLSRNCDVAFDLRCRADGDHSAISVRAGNVDRNARVGLYAV